MEMLSRQSEFRWSFPYREMLVFRTFGRLSLTTRNVGEMQLAVHEQCVLSEQARLLEPLQQGRVMSLVEDAAQVAELQAMQKCGLDPGAITDDAKSSADGQLSVSRVRDSARVMRVARLPSELELRQPASQPSTRDVG